MKKFNNQSQASMLFIALLFMLCSTHVFAQAPSAIPFQAVARDQFGNILANRHITLRFSIHDSIPAGPVVFSQTLDTTTNELGLFSVKIYQANTSTTAGPFNPSQWNKTGAFMQVELDADESGTFVDMGTQQILSVPFALFAEKTTPGSVIYSGTWNAQTNSPALENNVGTKGFYYVVLNAAAEPSNNTALNGIDDWAVGDWAIFNGTQWEKVDNSQAPVHAAEVSFTPNSAITSTNVQGALEELSSEKINLSGGTMTGPLLLNANPSSALGAATKQYVDATDASLQTQINTKVSKSGGTMTGDLILNADPTLSLGAATKKYVDSGDVATQSQFGNLIDSYFHKTQDGVYSYKGLAPGPLFKRFGIGITTPAAPLGIKGEDGGDDGMISLYASDESQKWNINLNPSGSVAPGLSIVEDRYLLGLREYRLFIQKSTGYVGIGTITPSEKLEVKDSVSDGMAGIKILNSAATSNQGWTLGHVHDPSDTRKDGALVAQTFVIGLGSRRPLTILTNGNVGIGEELPDVKLHVVCPTSEPNTEIHFAAGTGIAMFGPITDHIVADYRGIQARHGEYISTGLELTAADLNLQRLGGEILIHGSSSLDKQVVITSDGLVGLGKTPIERLDVNGAVTFGDSYSETPAEGTVRWHPVSDFSPLDRDLQVFKGGVWKSLTTQTVTDGLWTAGATAGAIYYEPVSGNAKVGIGLSSPDVSLHVSRPVSDLQANVDLAEGTGILVLGPMDNSNLVFDSRGIQARHGEYVGATTPVLNLSGGELRLQPVGGNTVFHSSSSSDHSKVMITEDGKVGIGTTTPSAQLEVSGKFIIGNDAPQISGSSISGSITNQASTASVSSADTRVALNIRTSGQWSTNAEARNVGIYVGEISGQSSANSNLAAVLNGNTVIGDLTGSTIIGTSGQNVLAIQNGVAPSSAPGTTTTAGIQIYSDDLTGVSVLHVMNGNGEVIKFYRESALTASNAAPVAGGYDANEAVVINNLRTRLNELESKLQNLGLLH